MKSLLLTFFLTATISYGAIINPNSPCKDWCGDFCRDSCESSLATPICLGETQCRCLCPIRQVDCNNTWCSSYCKTKADNRTFEAHCEKEDQLCKCQFDQITVPGKIRTKIQPVNITFVADPSLLKADFKCTQKFCDDYCTKRGEGRNFTATCDETQSCFCQYEQKSLPSLKSLSSGNFPAKCTKKWCSEFCNSKSNGLEVEATCDETQTCQCEFVRKPSITASGGPDRSSQNSTEKRPAKCTDTWCSSFCDSKSNGRKFTSSCSENQECKCEYAWQKTEKKTSSDSTSTKSRRAIKKFECTASWCSNYCDSKSNGREFTSFCNKNQECKCAYAWQPTEKKLPSDVPSKNLTETKQFKCTDTWCSSYCDSKSNGRKFTSACNENQECKCEYAWQPTGKKPTN